MIQDVSPALGQGRPSSPREPKERFAAFKRQSPSQDKIAAQEGADFRMQRRGNTRMIYGRNVFAWMKDTGDVFRRLETVYGEMAK